MREGEASRRKVLGLRTCALGNPQKSVFRSRILHNARNRNIRVQGTDIDDDSSTQISAGPPFFAPLYFSGLLALHDSSDHFRKEQRAFAVDVEKSLEFSSVCVGDFVGVVDSDLKNSQARMQSMSII